MKQMVDLIVRSSYLSAVRHLIRRVAQLIPVDRLIPSRTDCDHIIRLKETAFRLTPTLYTSYGLLRFTQPA